MIIGMTSGSVVRVPRLRYSQTVAQLEVVGKGAVFFNNSQIINCSESEQLQKSYDLSLKNVQVPNPIEQNVVSYYPEREKRFQKEKDNILMKVGTGLAYKADLRREIFPSLDQVTEEK